MTKLKTKNSPVKTYTLKPKTIKAIQFTGWDDLKNKFEVVGFIKDYYEDGVHAQFHTDLGYMDVFTNITELTINIEIKDLVVDDPDHPNLQVMSEAEFHKKYGKHVMDKEL